MIKIKEIWKDIPEYEGLYQASSLGNIRSIDRIIYDKNLKRSRNFKGKILKQNIRNDGYLFVNLSKNGINKVVKIHRIIAKTFIKNSNNYKCINHINGNKQDNNINNLEWCTYSHNIKEAYKLGLKKPISIKGGKNKCSKIVNQYDLDNNFIKKWYCIKDASKKLKIKDSNISLCCKGKRNKAGGYIWKYEEISD